MGPSERPQILVVDDSELDRLILERALSRRGYDVSLVSSGEEALATIAVKAPDVVLLDIVLPGMSGLELLQALREQPTTQSTPILLLSALSKTQDVVEGLSKGANDYVTKPVVVPILLARVEALLRSSALVRNLEAQTEVLWKLAAYDELTGIANRRSIFHALEQEIARSERYGRELSILMMDVDHFKRVNDGQGHVAGDAVLRGVAAVLQGSFRTIDVVGRYGGEEFCAILPETGAEGARRSAERARVAVESHAMEVNDTRLSVTISVGVTTMVPGPAAELDLLHQADLALLDAKRSGRNRAVVFEQAMRAAIR